MYKPSSSAFTESDVQEPNALERMISGVFLLIYFTLLPIVAVVLLNWLAYAIAATTFYQDPWMMPALLMFGSFLGGVLIRQKMEDERGGMSLFFLGIVALGIFAWLTWQDIDTLGGVYSSRFMPKLLKPSLSEYAFAIPAVGILGMLFYKYFTLKTYS